MWAAIPRLVLPGAALVALLACLSLVTATRAAELHSPNGRVGVSVELKDGRPVWSVAFDGTNFVQGGQLGMETAPDKFSGKYKLLGTVIVSNDTTWKPVWGNLSQVRDNYRELTVKLRKTGQAGQVLHIVLRVYNEGVGLRYVVPAQAGLERVTIKKRLTEYRFGGDRKIYQNRNYEYGTKTIATMSKSEGNVTVDVGGGRFVSLTDADRSDFSQVSWERKRDQPGTILGSLHSPARGTLPFQTSWEVIIIGETAGKLYENRHIVENLSPPCAIGDTSWIRPGEAICQVRNTRMVTSELRKLLEFASAHKIEYVEIDHSWCGAETKWTPAEIELFAKNKSKFWDDKPEWRQNVGGNPMAAAKGWVPFRPKADSGGNFVDLDVPALTAYGRSLNPPVGVCLYLRGAVLKEFGGEHAIEDVFATYERWGVAGVKPGFIPPASQQNERTISYMLARAAAHKLIAVIHDAYYPCGLSRTYPNLMNVEGVAGEEAEHSIAPEMKSCHDVMLPFTRCLMGPVDYTPEIFKQDSIKTHAHQVAMLGVYHGRPSIRGGMRQWSPSGVGGGEIEFVEKLPGLFDEMKVLGEIGKHVTVARRRGEAWYLASMSDAQARTVKLPLDFLRPGAAYQASIYADTPGKPQTTQSRLAVSSQSVLTIVMEPNGGHVAIIEPSAR